MPRIDGSFKTGSPVVRLFISPRPGSPQRPFDAVIDTGFDGAVRIPNDWAPEIGLKSTDTVTEQEMADGRVVPVALASGCVTLGDATRELLIHLQPGATEVLVGIDFLRAFRRILIVDVSNGIVALLDDVSEVRKPWITDRRGQYLLP